MPYALIDNNEVVELFGDTPALHPDLEVVRVAADVRQGWVRKGNKFVAPTGPEIAAVRADALAGIIVMLDALTTRVTARYPAAEIASWPTQEAEARAVLDGGDISAARLLAALAGAADMPIQSMAQAVQAKASAYRQIVAAVQMTRSQAEAAINAAQAPAEVGAAVDQVKAALAAKASDLGLG